MKSLSTREKALWAAMALIVGAFVVSIQQCNKAQHSAGKWALDYQNANGTVQTFKLDLSNKDKVIATQEALIGSERNAKILAEQEARKYKSIAGVVKVKTEFVIKNVPVPYLKHDTVTVDGELCVPVGTMAALNTKYYSIVATIDTNNIRIDSLHIPVNFSLLWGKQKRGLFKAPVESYSLVVDNPYISVKSMQNVTVKPKKPKRLVWLLTGLALGIATNFIH